MKIASKRGTERTWLYHLHACVGCVTKRAYKEVRPIQNLANHAAEQAHRPCKTVLWWRKSEATYQ